MHLDAANQNGTGSTNVIFSYDANPGETRFGTLTVAGQTVAVTQAGSTYVAAGAVTTLVATGLIYSEGVAVDAAGNVYLVDDGNNAIKKWTAANNTVTTLVSSGLSEAVGLAVDGAGNVYIADTYHNAVKELPYAFVDPTPRLETAAAGSDVLPVVLPATENLLPPFAPTSDSAWLTISGISNDVVSISFTASASPRVGHVMLLGQSISILQGVSLPAITSSPSNQTVMAGTAVTFSAGVTGSSPLAYQWQFDGANILGATNTSLTVSNALLANAGSYWMVATDPYGSATSSVAILSVDETTVQVVSTNAAGGGTVVVSIDMNAVGTESALGFSLDFNPSVLTYQGAALGSGAAGGALEVNTNQAASGVLGLGVDMFSGTFSSGTNDVLDVTFQISPVTNATTTTLTFGNQPTEELVAGAQAQTLPAVYLPGLVVIPPTSLAGDVSPRPNGNEVVNIADWVQEGRFVAGLDTVSNGSEFQRADCAPRATHGDGQITVADWVQVGRYAVGLDPITAAGGPTSPVSPLARPGHPIKTSLAPLVLLAPISQGMLANSVAVELVAQGNENALGFSVTFDGTMIHFVNASLGSGATGAALIQNTNLAARGVLGFVVGLEPPGTFAAGTQPLVNLKFASVSYSNNAALVFGDTPVVCQLVDAKANPLSANYQNASVAVGGAVWPALAISHAGSNVVLSWQTSALEFGLESTPGFGTGWSNVSLTPVTNGGSVQITAPASTGQGYFRLRQQ